MKFYKNVDYPKVLQNAWRRLEAARLARDERMVRHYVRMMDEIKKHLHGTGKVNKSFEWIKASLRHRKSK